jgi:hypothetical protein
MSVAVCTVLNSWWWTEKLSETCRVSCKNKYFEKLVHLVGFTIGIPSHVGYICGIKITHEATLRNDEIVWGKFEASSVCTLPFPVTSVRWSKDCKTCGITYCEHIVKHVGSHIVNILWNMWDHILWTYCKTCGITYCEHIVKHVGSHIVNILWNMWDHKLWT